MNLLHTIDWVLLFIALCAVVAIRLEARRAHKAIEEHWSQMYKGHIPLREEE